MSVAKPKFTPAPRPWNEIQVAARLNRGPEWFRRHREALESQGFPKRDALFEAWDSVAIERWMDRRSGLDLPENQDEAAALKIIHARAS